MEHEMRPLTDDELLSEQATALPDKEVASVLDLNADLDLGIDAAAPIDLAVAANANVAAPIDAAASANILSFGSDAQALADQGVMIEQGIEADANAASTQDSTISQGSDAAGPGETAGTIDGGLLPDGTVPDGTTPDVGALPVDPAAALDGDLLNVNVDLAADADIAAPIDAAVAANIGSIDSQAYAVAEQDAIISQHIDGEANASADQQSDLEQ